MQRSDKPGPHPVTQTIAPKQKLIFVTRKWPPAIGGMETYSVRLTEGLETRFDVTVLACPGQESGAAPKASTLIGFGLKSFLKLIRLKQPPKILHIGDMASWPLALPVRLRHRTSQIAISAHGTDVSYARRGGPRGRIYGAYLRLGRRLLGDCVIIANSRATASAAQDFGWTRVEIVPLASDLRTEVQSTKPSRSLLFAGRILPLKGLKWFVENVLLNLDEDITLRVAGTIWDDDEATCLNHDRVTYLGPLPQSDLIKEYQMALAVIIPNIKPDDGTFEGFGLVAAEASACGAVTLASASGGLNDAVLDGKTGFLVEPESAAAWTRKINEISEWTSEERSGFLAQSVNACRNHFTWARVTEDTCAAYETRFALKAPQNKSGLP